MDIFSTVMNSYILSCDSSCLKLPIWVMPQSLLAYFHLTLHLSNYSFTIFTPYLFISTSSVFCVILTSLTYSIPYIINLFIQLHSPSTYFNNFVQLSDKNRLIYSFFHFVVIIIFICTYVYISILITASTAFLNYSLIIHWLVIYFLVISIIPTNYNVILLIVHKN